MINNFYKKVNNKYLNIVKFLFYLRYLLGIFLISIAVYLTAPNLIDFKKRDNIIKNYLNINYGLELEDYENIEFNTTPFPNLKIKKASLKLGSSLIEIKTQNLILYPSILNIYNFDNFKINKIKLKKNKIILNSKDIQLLKQFLNVNKKMLIEDLSIDVLKDQNILTNLKKIKYANYGYDKNIIHGEVFEKKFKIKLKQNYQNIDFKLLDTGVLIKLIFNEEKSNKNSKGQVKSKILNTNLSFNFNYDDKKLNLENAYFRSKLLSFNSENQIFYSPFFFLKSNVLIKDLDPKIFKKINLTQILKYRERIKKINSENSFFYENKKFSRSTIDKFNLNVKSAHGRLVYSKKIKILENYLNCKGDINLMEQYPVINFSCVANIKSKKKLLKKFSVKNNIRDGKFDLFIFGNINILNNKINFFEIKSENYKASEEDLIFYKKTFEKILFDKEFIDIFNREKIKIFILEII